MYQKIRKAISDNKDVLLIGAVTVLTVVVIRTRPKYVQDVFITAGVKDLIVEFSDHSSNSFPLQP